MIVQLAIGIVVAVGAYTVGTHPETREFANVAEPSVILEEKMSIDPSPVPAPATEPLTAPNAPPTEVAVVAPAPVAPPVTPPAPAPKPAAPTNNEAIIWNRLISEGYSREQAAGIMGNLRQEHNFKTDDVPGGLGIAQWMGGRRAALMARGNYLDINVQMDHLIHELKTSERAAEAEIRVSGVYGATLAFQNKFERCHPAYCHFNQRLNYAHQILARY